MPCKAQTTAIAVSYREGVAGVSGSMLPARETVCAYKRRRALQGLQRRMAQKDALLCAFRCQVTH